MKTEAVFDMDDAHNTNLCYGHRPKRGLMIGRDQNDFMLRTTTDGIFSWSLSGAVGILQMQYSL